MRSRSCQKTVRKIREEVGINIHCLESPSKVVTKKQDSSVVYYCDICYVISENPGFCNEHGFLNPLIKGSTDYLEYYRKKNRLYDPEGGDDNLPPLK